MGRGLGVIPAVSVDVSIPDLSNLTHPGSRNQAPELLIFITDVNRFLERSMHEASCVSQINSINAIEFGLRGKCGPDRFELCRVQDEPGVERGTPWLLEASGRRLIPNDVRRPQPLDQHHHVDGLHRRVHAAAEERTDIVPGFPIQRQLDADFMKVGGNIGDAGAGTPIGGEPVKAPAYEEGFERFARGVALGQGGLFNICYRLVCHNFVL